MPISHSLKLLFIHIPRTAGTSIERALEIPPGDPDPYIEDRNNLFGRSSRGYLQHYTIEELLDDGLIQRQELESYFTFAIVRNPWDRIVSAYFYNYSIEITQGKSLTTFSELVRQLPDLSTRHQHFYPMCRYVHSKKYSYSLDFIGKLEELEQSMKVVADAIGLSTILLPGVNSTSIRQQFCTDYKQLYTSELKDIVASVYEEDLELFAYSFDS